MSEEQYHELAASATAAYNPVTPKGEFVDHTLYKSWFRTKTSAGLINISPWFWDGDQKPVGKMSVEIAKVDPNNQGTKVLSSTKCYVDAIDLAVYLRAVATGNAKALFPKKSGTYSPESFMVFGGSTKGTAPVARVLKIEWWGASAKNGEGDEGAFQWKCGHFEGRVSGTGAIEPDFSKPLSQDMIKRTRLQMAEISYRMDLALQGFAAQDVYWFGGG